VWMVLSPSRLAPRLPSASISPPASIFINKIMMSHLTLNFQRRSKPPACALVNDRDTNETFLNWAPIGRCKPTLPTPLLLGGDGRGVAVWQSCCAVPCCAMLHHAMPCCATTGPPSKGLHCWLEGAQQVMTDIKKVKHRAFSFFT